MTQRQLIPEQAKQHADNITREAKSWIEPLGRFGYAAKGAVYALIGVLAAQAAFGRGGETTDSQGALQRIVQAPFGKILLGIVAIGLVGYAIWRLVQAFEDTENKGSDAKGYITRAAYAGVGLAYLGLAFSAVRMITGSGGQSGGGQQGLTARLLAQPFGQLLVGLIGAVVIGVGAYQLYKAYSAKFREELKLQEMSQTEEQWATRSGRLGFAARGIVFIITGVFVITAALQTDASQARGMSGALDTLSQQQWLLGLVALGLIAYGLFCFVEARYRRMIIN
jgi:hypothetical protein